MADDDALPLNARRFTPLQHREEPTLGLFFAQLGDVPIAATKATPATGMAFLVRDDGLLATCAHVVQAMEQRPGGSFRVHGAVPAMPVSVEAEVLPDGWFGPPWSPDYGFPSSPVWTSMADNRPDTIGHDLAFLKLRMETARFDDWRRAINGKSVDEVVFPAGVEPSEAADLLLKAARVLPLGVPGYPSGSGIPLAAYHMAWPHAGVDLRMGEARFVAALRELYDAVRFKSAEVDKGFSGGPLWDDQRRLVIGMVRRGQKSTIPDAVVGTDSRAFLMMPGLSMQFDHAMTAAMGTLAAVVATSAPPRHFGMVGDSAGLPFIEPLMRAATREDPLAETGATPPPMAALATLERVLASDPLVAVSGSAGTGKSTLLYRLASKLCSGSPPVIAGRYAVPMLVTAADLLAADLDLVALLKMARRRLGGGLVDEQTMAEALAVNDAGLLLLVDGLDEVPRHRHAAILARLATMARNNQHIVRVVVTTRPVEALEFDAAGRTRQGFVLFELLTFNHEQVDAYARSAFSDVEEREQFAKWLRETRWDRRGPTPLQLSIAATVFQRVGGETNLLPKRAVDLSFVLIDELLAQAGEAAAQDRGSREPATYGALFRPNAKAILGLLAEISLDVDQPTASHLAERLKQTTAQPGAPEWLGDVGGLLCFLEQSSSSFGGLLTLSKADGDWRLNWFHRTILEASAVQAAMATLPDSELAGYVERLLRRHHHGTALIALAALDRAGKDAVVRQILTSWIERPQSEIRTTVLAMRALGAGVDGGEAMRQRLVDVLIRLLLTKAPSGMASCSEVFSGDDLPSPLDIARKLELRSVVIEALRRRFRFRDPRLRPGSANRFCVLTEREAKLLDHLGLWGEIDIPMQNPRALGNDAVTGTQASSPRRPAKEGGFTAHLPPGTRMTLTIRRRDGTIADFELDSMQFINQIIALARSRPGHLSAGDLISLYANYMVDLSNR